MKWSDYSQSNGILETIVTYAKRYQLHYVTAVSKGVGGTPEVARKLGPVKIQFAQDGKS